jgi:hypothetical protein
VRTEEGERAIRQEDVMTDDDEEADDVEVAIRAEAVQDGLPLVALTPERLTPERLTPERLEQMTREELLDLALRALRAYWLVKGEKHNLLAAMYERMAPRDDDDDTAH